VKSGTSSETVNLKLDGSDVVTVVVIAQDGTTLAVYTIAVVTSGTNTPAAPANAEAVAQDTSSILLSWNDNASNETGFSIRRSTYRDTGFVEINRVDSNRTSFADTGLNDGTEYFYRVTAFNNEGYSLPSNRASAITKVTLDVFSAKPHGCPTMYDR
jgi:fibronectin type 3 domain-containing protein